MGHTRWTRTLCPAQGSSERSWARMEYRHTVWKLAHLGHLQPLQELKAAALGLEPVLARQPALVWQAAPLGLELQCDWLVRGHRSKVPSCSQVWQQQCLTRAELHPSQGLQPAVQPRRQLDGQRGAAQGALLAGWDQQPLHCNGKSSGTHFKLQLKHALAAGTAAPVSLRSC